jgi:hypothetical protein
MEVLCDVSSRPDIGRPAMVHRGMAMGAELFETRWFGFSVSCGSTFLNVELGDSQWAGQLFY